MILKKRAEQAGVAHFAAHDLRRTFATHLLENGVDVLNLRNLMGHSSVTTTQSYDKRGEEAKREAIGSSRSYAAYGYADFYHAFDQGDYRAALNFALKASMRGRLLLELGQMGFVHDLKG